MSNQIATPLVLRRPSGLLVALLAVSIFLPVLLTAWFAYSHYVAVKRETHDSAQRSLVALQEHAANVLETHTLILQQVNDQTKGQSWQQIDRDEALQQTLASLTQRSDQIAVIGIADADGRLRTSSLGSNRGILINDMDFFKAHKDGSARGPFFSEPYLGQLTGKSQFALSIARTTPDGKFDGILFSAVPVEYFTRFWQKFVPSSGYLVPMIREDGVLLLRYPETDQPNRLDPNGPFVSHTRMAPEGIYTAISQVDGVERVNAYTRVKSYPLFISFSTENRIIKQKYRNEMLPGLIIAVLVMIAMAGFSLVVVRQAKSQHVALVKWRETATSLEAEVSRRQQAEEALRHGQKMEALGQLAGGIAHDFNNLLAGIVGNLELIRVHLEQRRLEAVSRAISAAEAITDTASSITKRLLAFSRRQVLSPSITQLNDRIVLMQGLIEQTVGPKISVIVSLEPELWPVLCDPNQLDTALLNLAINSRDAMSDGGTLKLTTENLSVVAQGEANGANLAAGDYILLTVADTGVGMTQEVLKRMFEPFFTTKPAGQGTGLGLAMIYNFVVEAAGQVQVSSVVGSGTTVRVYLPKMQGIGQ